MRYLRSIVTPALVVYVVVAVAHLGTLGFVTYLAHTHGQTLEQHLRGDIPGYIALAHRMLADGSFRNIDTALPETFRTPGYPGFVAIILTLTAGSMATVLILQALLLAFVAVFVFYICEALKLPKKFSVASGILCGLSPGMLGLTLGSVGGDALYMFLLLCALYAMLHPSRQAHPYLSGAGVGVMIGIAALIRPVGLYIAPVVVLGTIAMAVAAQAPKKKAVAIGFVTLVACGAVLLPWYLRNKIETGHFMLTSLPAFNLTWYNIPAFLAHQNGTSDLAERTKILRELGNPRPLTLYSYTMTDTLTAYDTAFFKQNLVSYVPFHVVKTIPFFVSSGLRDDALVAEGMGVKVPFSPNNDNLTSLLLGGHVREIMSHLVEFWPFAVESLGWALLFVLAFLAPLYAPEWRTRVLLMFAVGVVLVSAALTGPVAQARYRVPIEPYVWIGAAYTVWKIVERFATRAE